MTDSAQKLTHGVAGIHLSTLLTAFAFVTPLCVFGMTFVVRPIEAPSYILIGAAFAIICTPFAAVAATLLSFRDYSTTRKLCFVAQAIGSCVMFAIVTLFWLVLSHSA